MDSSGWAIVEHPTLLLNYITELKRQCNEFCTQVEWLSARNGVGVYIPSIR